MKKRRGRGNKGKTGRPPKLDKKVEEDLVAENQRLRMEIEYLKKLSALVLAEEREKNKKQLSYSISLSPDLQHIRDMLNGLFEKLPEKARPIFHSDQGWQYQHSEYQRSLAEHNITQSMSRKGNCMDNGAMENFFGRLKVEMFYGEHFQTVDEFINCLKDYIDYYNNERIISKLKMSPVQFRTHSLKF